MPRQPRQRSVTGIHHIMLKGIDERNIFMGDGDRKKFLTQLLQAREKGSFALLAYCLMDNHVHLVLEEKEEIGVSMKRITVGYALWHNHQYGRTGHLFRNRYQNEPVQTDAYLLTVVRYIHQNPVKAGLAVKAERYPWSSYGQYIQAYNGIHPDIDVKRIMDYFDSKIGFEKFMNEQQDLRCLEHQPTKLVSDYELTAIIQQKYHAEPAQKLTTEERKQLIKKIYGNETTSIRQLARVLGVSKWIVEQAL